MRDQGGSFSYMPHTCMELKKTTRFTPPCRAASYTLAVATTLSGISVSQPMSGVWRGSAARCTTASAPLKAGRMASRSVRLATRASGTPGVGTRSMPRSLYRAANACVRIAPMRPLEPVMTTVLCSANPDSPAGVAGVAPCAEQGLLMSPAPPVTQVIHEFRVDRKPLR